MPYGAQLSGVFCRVVGQVRGQRQVLAVYRFYITPCPLAKSRSICSICCLRSCSRWSFSSRLRSSPMTFVRLGSGVAAGKQRMSTGTQEIEVTQFVLPSVVVFTVLVTVCGVLIFRLVVLRAVVVAVARAAVFCAKEKRDHQNKLTRLTWRKRRRVVHIRAERRGRGVISGSALVCVSAASTAFKSPLYLSQNSKRGICRTRVGSCVFHTYRAYRCGESLLLVSKVVYK